MREVMKSYYTLNENVRCLLSIECSVKIVHFPHERERVVKSRATRSRLLPGRSLALHLALPVAVPEARLANVSIWPLAARAKAGVD